MGVGLLLVCAAPGLIPALLTLGGATSEEAARATFMQVFIRLQHHLDPTNFSATAWLAYAAMLAACGIGWWKIRKGNSPLELAQPNRWFARFVLVTAFVALVGTAIGWHVQPAWTMPYRDLRGLLLKFYPFRLADVFIPIAFAFLITRWLCLRPGRGRKAVRARSFGLAAITLGIALTIPAPDANPTSMPPRRLATWLDVAEWAEEETPPGSVIVTPTGHWGFRWYSNRAEYVNYKDAPQDAAGLLEWERRLAVIRDWWESSETGRYSQADLNRLGRKTGADYLVTIAMTRRFDVPPVYDNGTYRVYRLSDVGIRKSGIGSRDSEVGIRKSGCALPQPKTQNTIHKTTNPSDKPLPARLFVFIS